MITFDVEVVFLFFPEGKELYRKTFPIIASSAMQAETIVSNHLSMQGFNNFRILSTKEVIR